MALIPDSSKDMIMAILEIMCVLGVVICIRVKPEEKEKKNKTKVKNVISSEGSKNGTYGTTSNGGDTPSHKSQAQAQTQTQTVPQTVQSNNYTTTNNTTTSTTTSTSNSSAFGGGILLGGNLLSCQSLASRHTADCYYVLSGE